MKTIPLPLRFAIAAFASLLSTPPLLAGVQGRVTFADAPLPGVAVAAIPVESPFEEARREARDGKAPAPLVEVRTGPDGRFDLNVPVAPGKAASDFRLELRGAGVLPLRSLTVWSAGESDDLGEIAVQKGESFSGVVLDPSGKPLKGARIQGGPGTGGRLPSGFGTVPVFALSAEDGTFKLEGLAREGNSLFVNLAGFAPLVSQGGRLASSSKRLTLALGRAVTFQIVKADGKTAAAGALVRIPGSTLWREADGDGKVLFTLPRQAKGTLEADLGEAGWAEFRLDRLPSVLEAPVQVKLKAPAGLEGRVVDAETGKAVPRARLTVRSGSRVFAVRGGADGRYRFRPLPPGNYELLADDAKYVLYSRSVVVNAAKTTNADCPLVLGATVVGRVTDEEGVAVAGAEGRLERFAEANLQPFLRDLARPRSPLIITGPDGTFSGKRLLAGNGLRLQFTRSGFEPGHSTVLTLAAGVAKTGVSVVMRRGLTVTGTVKDLSGQPVPGAELRFQKMAGAVRMGRARFTLPRQTASITNVTSGADGRFEAKGLAAGDYSVVARRDGFADASTDGLKVVSGELVKPLELVLKPGAVITVKVMKKSGEPAEGLFLRVSEAGTEQPFGPARMGLFNNLLGPSQADGSILVEGLEAGKRYDLSLSTRSNSIEKRGILAPAENVEFVLPGTGSISGRVIDSDERPVTEFEISTASTPGAGGPGFVFRRPGAAQRFETQDGQFQIDDIPAGSWTITARAGSYQDGNARNIVVEEGGVKSGVEIRLQKSVKVAGKVSDARTGRAIADAGVSVRPVEGGGGPAILAFLDGSGSLVSDADGRFEADAVPGKFRVEVRHSNYAPMTQTVEVTAQGGTADLRLSKGGVLSGLVLSSDRRPVADAEVFLRESGDSPGRGGFSVGGNTTGTDASGRFRFENLSAARYQLMASLKESSSEPLDVVLEAGSSREDLVMTLATGATIRGIVTGLAESRRKGVQITATGSASYMESTFAAADGTFEIRGAPEGVIRISANLSDASGARRSSTQVTVGPGQMEVSAEVAFQGQSALSGRVLRGGQGIANVFVSASMPVGGRSSGGTARTDDQGSYRMEGLEDGDWTVSVNLPGSGGGKQEKVTVSGETQKDIVLPALRASGEVLESGTRRPLENVSITGLLVASGMDSPGRMPPRTQTDSAGKFLLEGLDSGRYSLRAERAGYQTISRDVDLTGNAADAVTIEMVRGQGIELVVRDGLFNLPLRGVMLRAEDPATKASFTGQVALDQDGRGEVSSLKPGTYKLWVTSSGYAPATGTVSVPGPAVELRLTPGGRITVRTGPKTSALPARRYKLLLPTGEALQSPYGPPLAAAGDAWRPLFDGLELQNLPPGPYSFVVDGGETRSISVMEGGLTVVELP